MLMSPAISQCVSLVKIDYDAVPGSFHATKSSRTSHSVTSLVFLNPLRPLSDSIVPVKLAKLSLRPRIPIPITPPRRPVLSLLLSLLCPW